MNGIFVSKSLNYEELKSFYSENKEVSINDAEGKLAQMGITEDEKRYRIIIQKIENGEDYTPFLELYLQTVEAEEDYIIEKICNAAVSITAKQSSAVFLGGITCWLRKNNKIEYSLNGDMFKAGDVQEDVICDEEKKSEFIQLEYFTEGRVKDEDGAYIYVHDTIML